MTQRCGCCLDYSKKEKMKGNYKDETIQNKGNNETESMKFMMDAVKGDCAK